ncbi:MAG TPA: class I lanthipeptide [Thermoanaerobaculia bacterium]|nr:class I lanthipeptide [Thermoanaerobaculia bacterium]
MKKKNLKRLQLNRETLRTLEANHYKRVAGGETDTSCVCIAPTGCECGSDGCGGTHLATQPCTLLTRCACTWTC